MIINHGIKHAGFFVMRAAVLVLLQHLAAPYVCAGITASVLQHKAAMVAIYAGNAEGGQSGTGTGFFVDQSGIIATSYGVISRRIHSPGEALFAGTGDGSYIQITKIVAVDKARGITLLKVDWQGQPIVTLSRNQRPVTGQSIFIAKKRSDPDGVLIEGKTAVTPSGQEVILLKSPVPAGISGSPVCDSAGNVIGMVGGSTEDPGGARRLVSAAYIADLLAKYRKSGPKPGDLSGSHEETGPGPDELEGELEKAKSLVQEDPDSVKALVMLGWAYSRSGMYADAIDAYRRAAGLSPDSAGIYNNIGVIYGMNMGIYDKAVTEFRKALQMNPDYDEARYNMAVAYLLSGDSDSALKEYRKLKKKDPEQASRLFYLIHEKENEEDQAMAGSGEAR